MIRSQRDIPHSPTSPSDHRLDVEQVLSLEIDSLISSVSKLETQHEVRSNRLEIPGLSVSGVDWANSFAEHLSASLRCEVWLVEIDSLRQLRRATSHHSEKALLTEEVAVSVAMDSAASALPIGSKGIDPSFAPSPILDNAVQGSGFHAGWCTSIDLPTLGGKLAIACYWDAPVDARTCDILKQLDGRIEASPGGTPEMSVLSSLATLYETSFFQSYGEAKWKRRSSVRWLLRHRLPVILVGCGLFVSLLFAPFPYRPQRDCQLEAAIRHYVASPIEGRLVKTFVRPGDEVKEGQVLASMEDMQLRRDLAAAEAELESAIKKRDIAMASSAWGDLRLARLECQQMELKTVNIRTRLEEMQVVSPADGILVQGDWYGNEGVPTTFGQSLFEIAPLDTMICEVHLKPEDLPWIHKGTKAILRTESTGSRSWSGRIQRIEPRAEIIHDRAVIVAEMEVENPDWLFRPGMKGEVVVETGYQSIGWILFHKPLRWLRNQWIW